MSPADQPDRIAALVDAMRVALTAALIESGNGFEMLFEMRERISELENHVKILKQGFRRETDRSYAKTSELTNDLADARKVTANLEVNINHAHHLHELKAKRVEELEAELSETRIRGLTIIQGLREELAAAKASVPSVPAKPDRSAEFATNQALKRTTPIWIVKDSDPKRDGCVRICYSGAETIEGPADPMCGGCYEAGQAYTAMRAEPGYDPNLSQYKMRSLMLARGCACRSQYLSGRRNEAVPRPNDAQPAVLPDDLTPTPEVITRYEAMKDDPKYLVIDPRLSVDETAAIMLADSMPSVGAISSEAYDERLKGLASKYDARSDDGGGA